MDEEIRKKLAELEERIVKLEGLFKSNPKVVSKEISIKEFILQKTPKDDVQKTLAIGYYLEKYDNLPAFNAKDLEDGFSRAKEKTPKNINYKVIKNIEKGYMMESKDKKGNLKAWSLTNSGEKVVENNFEKENNTV